MSPFEEAMAVAVKLPMEDRRRLAEALGAAPAPAAPAFGRAGGGLPLSRYVPRPDAAAWRKAETGHAVLNTAAGSAASASSKATGPAALVGMWALRSAELPELPAQQAALSLDALPRQSPVVVHTDVCVALALGLPAAVELFERPPVEIRLATATYLALLGAAQDPEEVARIRQFVQPYAVLSLGPMASSRAAELMLAHSMVTGMQPLDSLIAATAMAHEIPLVARDITPFAGVPGLTVCLPFAAG